MAARWVPTRRTDAFDVAVAVLLGDAAAFSLWIGSEAATGPAADYPRPLAVACLLVLHLALAVRRRLPLAALVVATAAFLPIRLFDIPEHQVASISLFIAIYTAGAYGGRGRDALRGAVVVAIAALVVWAVTREPVAPYEGDVPVELLNLFTAVINVFYVAAAWMLGDVVRTRRQREAALEAQSAALTAAHDDLARRAVVEERVRIARELHDVLAHHVSVMGVQAGAARRVLGTRPEAVPELLASIESSSREAVGELQRLLGLLRSADDGDDGDDGDEPGGRGAPQPTLARLDALVAQMGEAGLDVRVDVDGVADGSPLPGGIELSAFRIVQEALTNTLKHGGAGVSAVVALHRGPSALELSVLDDGVGERQPVPAGGGEAGGAGQGLGLVGMRERVALHGGELRTGRRPGGGYEVRAWFPLPAGGRK